MDPVASAPDCPQCGRALRPEDAWCSLCFAPAPLPTFRGPVWIRRSDDPAPVEVVQHRYSRWAASGISFGPLGRVLASVTLVAIGPVFLWFSQVGGWLFFLMWSAVFVPWGMRDVWRKVRVRR